MSMSMHMYVRKVRTPALLNEATSNFTGQLDLQRGA